MSNIVWRNARNSMVLSPRHGGRIVSWMHHGVERVTPPMKLEGGLLRVLFGEERYPGASYITPHEVVSHAEGPDGFRLHLRHYWNTPNRLMRDFGWAEKASLLHIDGLLLDKIVTFHADTDALTVEMTIRNLTREVKYLSPWLHNSFARWATERFMVEDGRQAEYHETDIYWGCHGASPGHSLRGVLGDGQGSYLVLGASADLLAGIYAEPAQQVPDDIFTQASLELRYDGLRLPAGQQLYSTAFLAFADDWRRWAVDSPVALITRIEPAPAAEPDLSALTGLLSAWALPEEAEQGVMVLSYLDKAPFTSDERFHAANSFAGFHQADGRARAQVALYGLRDLPALHCALSAPAGWNVSPERLALPEHGTAVVSLYGPENLAGKEAVTVSLKSGGDTLAIINIDAGATVEPAYPYQVKPFAPYMTERMQREWGPFDGNTMEQFHAWQRRRRDRLHRYIAAQVSSPCPLEPRVVERQVGPTCVREKVLIQTEPGFWIPAYVVYAKDAAGKLPAIIFYHGSGPGKQNFVPDEDPACPRVEPAHEMEYLPYRLAVDLGCLVLAPDLRWLGELAESNPAQYLWRHEAAGIDFYALFAWDLLRHVDYLCTRADVDAARIGAYGSSGGGGATALLSLLDERIGAAIVSSTAAPRPNGFTLPEGFFYHMRNTEGLRLSLPPSPLYGADSCSLIAPRPLWIMDGIDDAPPESRDAFHRSADAGRAIIRHAYQLLNAGDRYQSTWFDGGHCAGMTYANIAGWFRRWLG